MQQMQGNPQPVSFAKIVATPSSTSWSQVYNAGSLFVVLSLEIIDGLQNDNLNAIEKEVFNNLEAEFFSLEKKNLETIKEAVTKTIETFPPEVSVSLGVAFITNDTLYLVVLGGASVHICRDNKMGVLIASTTQSGLQSASGYLKDHDMVAIQTKKFADSISRDMLASALKHDTPEEISDALSSVVIGKDDGGLACIILMYHQIIKTEDQIPQSGTIQNLPQARIFTKDRVVIGQELLLKIRPFFTHSRRVSFTILIILLIILGVSVLFALQFQEKQAAQKRFQRAFESAQNLYDEGTGLSSLNKPLAKEDLIKAKDVIEKEINSFKKGSSEYDKLATLLSDINKQLEALSDAHNASAKEAGENNSSFLSLAKKFSSEAVAFTADENFIYFINEKTVTSVDKGNQKTREIIKNNGKWKQIGGFGKYLSNFYILDKENGISKFSPSGNTFSTSDYLSGEKQNLSATVSIAIDGSIWVLSTTDITKYTKGKKDNFTLTGFDMPLKEPTRIFTSADIPFLYILDNGNNRIVKLDKKGAYNAQFSADVLKNAREFEVIEKENKAFVLSDNKIWEIPLK